MTSLAEDNPALRGALRAGRGAAREVFVLGWAPNYCPKGQKANSQGWQLARSLGELWEVQGASGRGQNPGSQLLGLALAAGDVSDGQGQLAPLTCCPCSLPTCRFCSSSALFPIRIFWTPSGAYWGQRTGRTTSECCVSPPAPTIQASGLHTSTKLQSPRDRAGRLGAGTRLTPGGLEGCHGDSLGWETLWLLPVLPGVR